MKNGILLILILQLGLVNLGKACDCDYGYIYHNSVEVFIGYAERIELEEGGAWKGRRIKKSKGKVLLNRR